MSMRVEPLPANSLISQHGATELERSVPALDDADVPRLSLHETYRTHHDALVSFLRRRLRVPEDAFDLAQETYVRMLRYEHSALLRSPQSMLFRIAINVANDHGRAERSRRRSGECTLDGHDVAADVPTPLREVAASQDLAVLLDAIDNLPPKCKKVFLLSRVHHLTYREIAARCGISVKMVEKHVSHALSICLAKLGGELEEHS